MKCYWDEHSECRLPKALDDALKMKDEAYAIKHCELCLMGEITRQLRLLATRQS